MPLKALLGAAPIFARDAIGTGIYTCHECASDMHYRRTFKRADGVRVQAHFAHNPTPRGQEPRLCSTTGQSEEHLNAKECIRLAAPTHFSWLRGIAGDVEVPIGNRRADVLFTLPGDIRIIFEPQFTKIPRSQIAERTKDYHDLGCHVVWCFPQRRTDLFTFCKYHFYCVGLLSDDGNEVTFYGNMNPVKYQPSLRRSLSEYRDALNEWAADKRAEIDLLLSPEFQYYIERDENPPKASQSSVQTTDQGRRWDKNRPSDFTTQQLKEASHAWAIGGSLMLGAWAAKHLKPLTVDKYGRLVSAVRMSINDTTDYSQV